LCLAGERRLALELVGHAWRARDHERRERSDRDDGGADEDGWVHPFDEALARAVYGVVGFATAPIQASAAACIARPTPIRESGGFASWASPV
jgi:hypothetical protein